jgi:hypothetical protein
MGCLGDSACQQDLQCFLQCASGGSVGQCFFQCVKSQQAISMLVCMGTSCGQGLCF